MYKDIGKNFDIRVIEKKIQEGTVSRQEYETYLGSLSDVSANIDEEYRLSFREIIRDKKNETSQKDLSS